MWNKMLDLDSLYSKQDFYLTAIYWTNEKKSWKLDYKIQYLYAIEITNYHFKSVLTDMTNSKIPIE